MFKLSKKATILMRSNSPLILSSQTRGLLSPTAAGTLETRNMQQPFSGPNSPVNYKRFDTYQDANNYLNSVHYQVLQ